jgi:hypothetical protein
MKDPAVLFYTSDFIAGTLTMTDSQRGQYIILLCLQHQKGYLTENDMLKICNSHDEDIWSKFEYSEGKYYNKRMKDEAEKRKRYSESRRNNRINKNNDSEHMNNICKTYDKHMENENINVNEVKNKNEENKNSKKCLMKNSGITVSEVIESFSKSNDLVNADAKYYYNLALDWSDAKGEMRKDWVAVVRTFARRAISDGKLKLKNTVTANPTNVGKSVPADFGKVSPNAMTLEEYRKMKEYEKSI